MVFLRIFPGKNVLGFFFSDFGAKRRSFSFFFLRIFGREAAGDFFFGFEEKFQDLRPKTFFFSDLGEVFFFTFG